MNLSKISDSFKEDGRWKLQKKIFGGINCETIIDTKSKMVLERYIQKWSIKIGKTTHDLNIANEEERAFVHEILKLVRILHKKRIDTNRESRDKKRNDMLNTVAEFF